MYTLKDGQSFFPLHLPLHSQLIIGITYYRIMPLIYGIQIASHLYFFLHFNLTIVDAEINCF